MPDRVLIPARRAQIAQARPAHHAPHAATAGKPLSRDALAALLSALPRRQPLLLSFSHDDVMQACGGVQNAVREEMAALRKAGWHYLHASPAEPSLAMPPPADAAASLLALRLDGVAIGTAPAACLAAALGALRPARLHAVVHHLIGLQPEAVADVIEAAGLRHPIVWVHDFFSLCPSYRLLRNDAVPCGAPPRGSQACDICVHGEQREAMHGPRIARFFERMRPFVLAPSGSALALWRAGAAGLPRIGEAVQPLMRLGTAPGTLPHGAGGALRIAHPGMRDYGKGWPVFEILAARFAADPRYAFWQIGEDEARPAAHGIRHRPARVGPATPHAMVDAITETGIDVALLWPLWPETFCYVAHEAIAAGAFIVTHQGAGNLPALLRDHPGSGVVLPDTEALLALFDGDGLARALGARRRQFGALLPLGGSAAWLARRGEQDLPARHAMRA